MAQSRQPKLNNFDKPTPREPHSAAKAARVEVQNRRREYLRRRPSYFDNLEHELADPILYERLVKRFQSADERTVEGKAKGYGRALEADLLRGESKLAQIDPSRGPLLPAKASKVAAYLDKPWDQPAEDKETGREMWRVFLTERFVQGEDQDFGYAVVDTNEDYGVMARDDALDKWFDDEQPSWEDETPAERVGETGIQDF